MDLQLWLEKNLGYEVPKPGLARIQRAIDLFRSELKLADKKIVSIGGTNGKGQTSRLLYAMALERGSAALWTSPHLKSVCERFSKNGQLVDESELRELFLSSRQVLIQNNLSLSYYEFLFLVFLRFSADCETLILEVGLGGRFDAVNALEASVVALTSIGRDHQDYLGNRLDGILEEKLALARPGASLLTNFELRYLQKIASDYCRERSIEHEDLFASGRSRVCDSFGKRNLLLAQSCCHKVFGELPARSGAIDSKMLDTTIEFSIGGALCHALTSHNPDGVRKGVQFLNDAKYTEAYSRVLLSFSNRRFDDAMTMIKTLKLWGAQNQGPRLALTCFEHPKAMAKREVEELARQAQVEFVDDAKTFFQTHSLAGERILALGSNYFIGELLSLSSPETPSSRK